MLSIVLMSLSTACIGLLPSFEKIGIWAPILLISLRIIQGLAISSEYNGVAAYLSFQNHLKNKFGLLCSITPIAVWSGYFSGNLLISLLTRGYTLENMPQWCWRGPFIVSGLLVCITGLWLRLSMSKGAPTKQVRIPLFTVIKSQKKQIFCCAFLSGYVGVAFFIFLGYLPGYLQKHEGYSLHQAFSISNYLSLLTIGGTIISGLLSDKIDRLLIMKVSAIGIILCAFGLLALGHIDLLLIFSAIAILTGLFNGPLPAVLAQMFYQEQRYTGSALAHNIGLGWIGAGTAQLGLTMTTHWFALGTHMLMYLALFAFFALLSLTALSQFNTNKLLPEPLTS
jgi:MHS family proline/betaine transporter-like MFS transporter